MAITSFVPYSRRPENAARFEAYFSVSFAILVTRDRREHLSTG